MNDQDYMRQSIDMIRERWFPNHMALRDELISNGTARTGNIQTLRWQNPRNSNYAVLYFLHRSTLFVSGDIGSAVYRWSVHDQISLQWIARCNFSYFAEKIEGLDGSEQGEQWRSDIAEIRAKEHFRDQRAFPLHWQDHIHTRDEWWAYVWGLSDCDNEIKNQLLNLGFVPHSRVIGHWLGLRMAFEIPTT